MSVKSILLPVAALLCASCNGGNPSKVWLALNGSERAVQLIPFEPDPF